jgi:hypothetical protein
VRTVTGSVHIGKRFEGRAARAPQRYIRIEIHVGIILSEVIVKATGVASFVLLLMLPALLLPSGPACAVDLNGRRLVVESLAEDSRTGVAEPRSVEIVGAAGLVHWATLPAACAVNGSETRLAMVYGPEPNRTGRIDCDPQRESGRAAAGGNSLRALAATYRSTYGNAADTLALTGRMTIRESVQGRETSEATTDVKQAITVRIAGARCEVLDFVFEMTTQRRTRRTGTETKSSTDHQRWTLPGRSCAVR